MVKAGTAFVEILVAAPSQMAPGDATDNPDNNRRPSQRKPAGNAHSLWYPFGQSAGTPQACS